MFTGDGSGEFLFRALHQTGFASQPQSIAREDGMEIDGLYISAVCRCAPPENKPTQAEISSCLPFLEQEIDLLQDLQGFVALGQLAFDNILRLLRRGGHTLPNLKFAHGAFFYLGENLPWLLASYHPSRQNTQTGRLTEKMFAAIWEKVRVQLMVGL
jgi:uracil-DNA glycosylase family 4